jgi:hypothetical protein
MSELHLAPNGAAVSPAAAPLISHEQLQRLYDLMLHCQLADTALRQIFLRKKWSVQNLPQLDHPAGCAGLFSHLRAGDLVAASSYAFAANLATHAPLVSTLRSAIARAKSAKPSRKPANLNPAEQLAAVAGAALAQTHTADRNIVVAFPAKESWQKEKSSATVLRWSAERHLPILYVTFARDLPKPGHSQSAFGLPQIAVDANDVVAVYRVAQECILRARTGVGPSWIQCVISDSGEPLAVMQKFLEARKLFEPSRKKSATQAWREQWKQSWQAASLAPQEPLQPLPIVSFDVA